MRRWVKILTVLLGLIALGIGSLFALKSLDEWRYRKAIAAAEARNLAEWRDGTAIRAKMAVRITTDEGARETTNEIICFRKQLVTSGRGIFRGPGTQEVYRPLVFKSVFSAASNAGFVTGIPTADLCAQLFAKQTPELPHVLTGRVTIQSLPEDDGSQSAGLIQFAGLFAPVCHIDWNTKAPLLLEHGIKIDPVVLSVVENVPMQSALDKPQYMGPAEAYQENIFRLVARNRPDTLGYKWDRSQLCWVSLNDTDCKPRIDDKCGVPRL